MTPHDAGAQPHIALDRVEMHFARPGGAGAPIHALGPLSLELRQGEFFAVVGPSGCGKSTLLELMIGLSAPSKGQILFEGQPITGRCPDGVGVVFQDDATFAWLTVRENIAFGLQRMTLSEQEKKARIENALTMMGLGDFQTLYPAQLSGGMRQRVCIARTLVTEPRLILLDEPFGALDQQTRLLMGDELLNLWRKTGATIFLITHALDEATMLADRIGVMSARPGQLIDLVETQWPKERTSQIVEEDRFGQVTARLWRALRAQSMKALGKS